MMPSTLPFGFDVGQYLTARYESGSVELFVHATTALYVPPSVVTERDVGAARLPYLIGVGVPNVVFDGSWSCSVLT